MPYSPAMKSPARRFPTLLAAIVLAGAALRLGLAWSGLPEGVIIADDAYYYFRIAANLAAGLGPTFDGLAPTNGFHPLWLALLVPVFAVPAASPWTPVRLALGLSGLLDVATGLLLLRILARAGVSARGRTAAAALWFLSPVTVLVGLRGLEASLAACLVLAVTERLLAGALDSRRGALGLGLLLGLAGLARTDAVAALGLAALTWTFADGGLSRRRAIHLGLAAGAAMLVLAPWLLWCRLEFGSVVQVSGLVKRHFPIYGTLDPLGDGPRAVLRGLADRTLAPLLHAARFAAGEEFRAARWALAVTAAMVLALAVPAALRPALLRRHRRLLAVAGTYAAVHVILLCWAWGTYINWYGLPVLALHALAVGALLDGVGRRTATGLAGGVLILATVACTGLARLEGHGPAGGPADRITRFQELARRRPDGVTAGAFNAGVLGYLAPFQGPITVTNLDGRVNNAAYAAARADTLDRWIAAHVDVLLEPPRTGHEVLTPAGLARLEARYARDDSLRIWVRRD